MLIEQYSFLLIFMVFVLGLRHGFDLDHIATIDSIARATKENSRLAKYTGFLFSLGHGFVVIIMCLVMSTGFIHVQSSQWMESFGHWISIIFLIFFGLITFWNTLGHSHPLPTRVSALLFRIVQREIYNPYIIIVIGALFALSFDTLTQVALFSISVSVKASVFLPMSLGVIFMLGMMTSDGLNGWVVSTLIQRADERSMLISRGVGLIIAGFSLCLACIEIAG